tara:strand:+ start:979 stop:1413 length:435 start_codon:yes stop_codon:yes gene_type:complete
MPSTKKNKPKNKPKNITLFSSFGRSDCVYSGDMQLPQKIGNNWIWHLSYCRPDNSSSYIGTNYADVKYLHVTAIYNVGAAIGLGEVRGDDIRVHYGYRPQNLQSGPMFWTSYNWGNNYLDQSSVGQRVKQFIQQIFNGTAQIIQ